jgi:hypothetical protein
LQSAPSAICAIARRLPLLPATVSLRFKITLYFSNLPFLTSFLMSPILARLSSQQSSRGGEQLAQEPYQGSEFVSRMSALPLVGTAMWAYEHGKASSRVVKVSHQTS